MSMSYHEPTVGSVAVVYGARAGLGGLGLQSLNAVTDVAAVAGRVLAVGPGPAAGVTAGGCIDWHDLPPMVSPFVRRWSWLRWQAGRLQQLADGRLGKAAAERVARARPACCYCFTQVALETLRWANRAGVPAVLESPNGHLRDFRAVYVREATRLGAGVYRGHPSEAMVERVEEEYARADRIRVSSEWARASLVAGGVPADKVVVVPQRPSARGFSPPTGRLPPAGSLRVCFVGTLDLRKGFTYLLRAARRWGAGRVALRLVGGTVDRPTRRLLERERAGLDVTVAPGEPLPHLHWAELFVLPTLEDGSPFAVVEAMAAGVPLVVTDACGNASLVRPGETGWVVPAGDEDALVAALSQAFTRRAELAGMGAAARTDWERLDAASNVSALRALLEQVTGAACPVG
jgi:glycosyltransferase involved in cell wall biosynthesis